MIIKHLLSKSFSRRSNYPKLHLFYAVISNKLRTFVPVSISLIDLNLSANSVMRGRLDARRTLKSLVADLRIERNKK